MDIAIIRHLPTAWNDKGYLQGRRDIPISLPISDQTWLQIKENNMHLENLKPFDYVFSSELKRTQQTANLYGYPNVTSEPLLNELDFGSFEGKLKTELEKKYDDKWLSSPLQMNLGESLLQFQNRVLAFIQKYAQAKKILIFGHGSWTRALLSISEIGNIQNMNRIEIENNQLALVKISIKIT